MDDLSIQAGLLTALMLTIELCKALIKKIKSGRTVEEAIITPENLAILLRISPQLVAIAKHIDLIKDQTAELHRWHNIRDAEGLPIWYSPRSWMDLHKEMRGDITKLNNTVDEMKLQFSLLNQKLD